MIIKSLNAKTQVVWSEDPALDREALGFAEAWARYERARYEKTRDNGLLYATLVLQGREGPTTTNELTRSAFRLFSG